MVLMSQQINPFSSSNENTPRGWPISKQTDQGDQGKPTIGRNAFLTQILI